jgi:hypothetical protein
MQKRVRKKPAGEYGTLENSKKSLAKCSHREVRIYARPLHYRWS